MSVNTEEYIQELVSAAEKAMGNQLTDLTNLTEPGNQDGGTGTAPEPTPGVPTVGNDPVPTETPEKPKSPKEIATLVALTEAKLPELTKTNESKVPEQISESKVPEKTNESKVLEQTKESQVPEIKNELQAAKPALKPEGKSAEKASRDLENEVILQVLSLLTDSETAEACQELLSGTASPKPDEPNTQEAWRCRELSLLDTISALEAKLGGSADTAKDQIVRQEHEDLTNGLRNLLKENSQFRDVLGKMTILLKDRTGLCVSQEQRLSAMTSQVTSLKEVVAITKDLLNIRNLEVQHLSMDIANMQTQIDGERERHSLLLVKMDKMMNLNSALKKEYETQLKIFQELRDKYDAKVAILTNQH